MRDESLETKVRRAVLAFVMQGRAFRAAEVAEKVGAGVKEVDRVLKALDREGAFTPFGFRRRHVMDRGAGFAVSKVEYAPRLGTEHPSKAPTRRPAAGRPYAYLGLEGGDARKLKRQTDTLKVQIHRAGRDLFRVAELLFAVERLVGPTAFTDYVERELGMSGDTARRLVRVARVFERHPKLDALSILKPSILYTLSRPSFPVALREAILAHGGLSIDGRRRELATLSVRELRLAADRYLERERARAELQRAIKTIKDPRARTALEARLVAIDARSIVAVETDAARSAVSSSLEELSRLARALTDDPAPWLMPKGLREDGVRTLRKLIAHLDEAEK